MKDQFLLVELVLVDFAGGTTSRARQGANGNTSATARAAQLQPGAARCIQAGGDGLDRPSNFLSRGELSQKLGGYDGVRQASRRKGSRLDFGAGPIGSFICSFCHHFLPFLRFFLPFHWIALAHRRWRCIRAFLEGLALFCERAPHTSVSSPVDELSLFAFSVLACAGLHKGMCPRRMYVCLSPS